MYVTLDTNILLLDSNNIFTIAETYPDRTILLPETVIDELDSKKSIPGSLGYHSRAFGRLIAKATLLGNDRIDVFTRSKLQLDNIRIDIVACERYPNYSSLPPSVVNDQKIIFVASQFADNLFISNDTMCRIRAGFADLATTDFKYVETTDIAFSKELTLHSQPDFDYLEGKPIIGFDPEWSPEISSYRFICATTGQVKLGVIENGIIAILDKEREKKLREQLLPPVNSGQLILSSLIQDQTTDITICEALAGSGFY